MISIMPRARIGSRGGVGGGLSGGGISSGGVSGEGDGSGANSRKKEALVRPLSPSVYHHPSSSYKSVDGKKFDDHHDVKVTALSPSDRGKRGAGATSATTTGSFSDWTADADLSCSSIQSQKSSSTEQSHESKSTGGASKRSKYKNRKNVLSKEPSDGHASTGPAASAAATSSSSTSTSNPSTTTTTATSSDLPQPRRNSLSSLSSIPPMEKNQINNGGSTTKSTTSSTSSTSNSSSIKTKQQHMSAISNCRVASSSKQQRSSWTVPPKPNKVKRRGSERLSSTQAETATNTSTGTSTDRQQQQRRRGSSVGKRSRGRRQSVPVLALSTSSSTTSSSVVKDSQDAEVVTSLDRAPIEHEEHGESQQQQQQKQHLQRKSQVNLQEQQRIQEQQGNRLEQQKQLLQLLQQHGLRCPLDSSGESDSKDSNMARQQLQQLLMQSEIKVKPSIDQKEERESDEGRRLKQASDRKCSFTDQDDKTTQRRQPTRRVSSEIDAIRLPPRKASSVQDGSGGGGSNSSSSTSEPDKGIRLPMRRASVEQDNETDNGLRQPTRKASIEPSLEGMNSIIWGRQQQVSEDSTVRQPTRKSSIEPIDKIQRFVSQPSDADSVVSDASSIGCERRKDILRKAKRQAEKDRQALIDRTIDANDSNTERPTMWYQKNRGSKWGAGGPTQVTRQNSGSRYAATKGDATNSKNNTYTRFSCPNLSSNVKETDWDQFLNAWEEVDEKNDSTQKKVSTANAKPNSKAQRRVTICTGPTRVETFHVRPLDKKESLRTNLVFKKDDALRSESATRESFRNDDKESSQQFDEKESIKKEHTLLPLEKEMESSKKMLLRSLEKVNVPREESHGTLQDSEADKKKELLRALEEKLESKLTETLRRLEEAEKCLRSSEDKKEAIKTLEDKFDPSVRATDQTKDSVRQTNDKKDRPPAPHKKRSPRQVAASGRRKSRGRPTKAMSSPNLNQRPSRNSNERPTVKGRDARSDMEETPEGRDPILDTLEEEFIKEVGKSASNDKKPSLMEIINELNHREGRFSASPSPSQRMPRRLSGRLQKIARTASSNSKASLNSRASVNSKTSLNSKSSFLEMASSSMPSLSDFTAPSYCTNPSLSSADVESIVESIEDLSVISLIKNFPRYDGGEANKARATDESLIDQMIQDSLDEEAKEKLNRDGVDLIDSMNSCTTEPQSGSTNLQRSVSVEESSENTSDTSKYKQETQAETATSSSTEPPTMQKRRSWRRIRNLSLPSVKKSWGSETDSNRSRNSLSSPMVGGTDDDASISLEEAIESRTSTTGRRVPASNNSHPPRSDERSRRMNNEGSAPKEARRKSKERRRSSLPRLRSRSLKYAALCGNGPIDDTSGHSPTSNNKKPTKPAIKKRKEGSSSSSSESRRRSIA